MACPDAGGDEDDQCGRVVDDRRTLLSKGANNPHHVTETRRLISHLQWAILYFTYVHCHRRCYDGCSDANSQEIRYIDKQLSARPSYY